MSEDKTHKFVRSDDVSSLFDSLIRKNGEEHSLEYPVSVFDPSHLTECPRRIIYRANGCKSEKSIPYLTAHNQLFIRKKWLEYLAKCKSIKMINKNVVAADCHYNISGNVDAILNIGDIVYVTKIQTLNNEDFLRVQKKGAFKKHVIETIVYIWLTELRDGLLLYENQDTNEYMSLHIKLYEPIIKSVMKKCLGLMEDKIQGVVPPRPYKSDSSSECVVCEFTKKCWQEKNKNV